MLTQCAYNQSIEMQERLSASFMRYFFYFLLQNFIRAYRTLRFAA